MPVEVVTGAETLGPAAAINNTFERLLMAKQVFPMHVQFWTNLAD